MSIFKPDKTITIDPLAVRSQEAADMLGISLSTLQRLTQTGEIRRIKVRNCTIYSVENLRDWLAAQQEGVNHETH